MAESDVIRRSIPELPLIRGMPARVLRLWRFPSRGTR